MTALTFGLAGGPTVTAEDASSQPVYKQMAKPDQTEPAEALRVEPITEDLRNEYGLGPLYKKAVVIEGIPIIGSEKVSDYAFLECAWIVDHLLAGRDRIKRALAANKVRIGIMAVTEYTMDIPEYQRPRMIARGAYHDRRARGLGGSTLTTCGEENLLDLRGDPYRLENITIHEFAHTIASNLRRVDRDWWEQLEELYQQAMDEGLWENSYAATSIQEYWAEGTQSWFDCNTPRDDGRVHNGIWNRDELKKYDPRLAAFLAETFGDRPWRYEKPTARAPEHRAHLTGFDPEAMPRFSFGNSPRIQAERTSVNRRRREHDTSESEPFVAEIRVDANSDLGELKPIWRYFGADEPNYAYMPNGEKLLGELGALAPQRVFFRTHNLLCSGDGTPALKWGSTGVYSEDADGNPIYDWTIMDRILDAYLEAGVRPYAQIGFMPKALSIHPDQYQHDWKPGDPYDRIFTGWAYPPEDYEKWEELVYQWVRHSVERYGKDEVESWYWQVWNEADIGYWQGRPRVETFLRLHDHAIAGVKRALPTAKVGGPDIAYNGDFLRAFLEHCLRGTNHATGEMGTPIDFISFHAKGNPRLVSRGDDHPGHVRMGMGQQLRAIDNSMRIVASFPELNDTPIIIGESDPDGCAACRATEYPQYAYRNTSQFASYTAASFARKYELAERHGVNLEGALTWSFTFEDQPLFAGLRALATGGIDKPILNTFRMFAKMGGRRLAVESSHGYALEEIMRRDRRRGAEPGEDAQNARRPDVVGQPDVHALASLDGDTVAVMVWHYHADAVPGADAAVELTLFGLPMNVDQAALRHWGIDDEHSNAFTVWRRMGLPKEPTAAQYEELLEAGRLAPLHEPETVTVEDGRASIDFELPRQGVSLLLLEWNDVDGG